MTDAQFMRLALRLARRGYGTVREIPTRLHRRFARNDSSPSEMSAKGVVFENG